MTNNIIRGLLPDGHAPSVLREEILSLIKSNTPAQGAAGGPTTTVTTGTVTLGSAASAAFEVLGDVSYAAGITWLGGQPPAGFRGVVALSRSTGGTVLGVWRAFSGAAPTPVAPSPAPVNPVTPSPVTPTTGEAANWNFTWANNGFVDSATTAGPPKILALYFKTPDEGGWVLAWQYPHRQDTWEPVADGHPTYAPQNTRHKARAIPTRPLGEGDAWVFTTKNPMSGVDSFFVTNDGGQTAKIAVKDGAYGFGKSSTQDGVFGSAGTEYADGSWNAVPIKAGDKLEIKRSEGYAVGSVIRSNGAKEQIFAFKFDWKNTTAAEVHGWGFGAVKAEVVRSR